VRFAAWCLSAYCHLLGYSLRQKSIPLSLQDVYSGSQLGRYGVLTPWKRYRLIA
jgi:hypothetical protein